ncbi:MAG: response regulator transcription factor [Alphaproteobacteria bacterium]|nr:response regulator transcription factor [Alphaproteobacteria bacterium]
MLPNSEVLPNPRVLLIEDDPRVGHAMLQFVTKSGMTAKWVRSATEAMGAAEQFAPEVVLVDLGLPDANGLSLISWFAARRSYGIIIVTGNGDEAERVVGIELGADDYVVKPASLRELVARIRAVHRRISTRAVVAETARADLPFRIGRAIAWLNDHRVVDERGEPIHLTAAEFKALEVLLQARGNPVPRERLCELALHRRLGADDRSVDQLILSIRRKLAQEGEGQRLISAVRGAGYVLNVGSATQLADAPAS